jgi:hypothetical protein
MMSKVDAWNPNKEQRFLVANQMSENSFGRQFSSIGAAIKKSSEVSLF